MKLQSMDIFHGLKFHFALVEGSTLNRWRGELRWMIALSLARSKKSGQELSKV